MTAIVITLEFLIFSNISISFQLTPHYQPIWVVKYGSLRLPSFPHPWPNALSIACLGLRRKFSSIEKTKALYRANSSRLRTIFWSWQKARHRKLWRAYSFKNWPDRDQPTAVAVLTCFECKRTCFECKKICFDCPFLSIADKGIIWMPTLMF